MISSFKDTKRVELVGEIVLTKNEFTLEEVLLNVAIQSSFHTIKAVRMLNKSKVGS
jgi:hypothetical protein